MFKTIRNKLMALHRDEQGADMVEYILIVAILALPLLGALIWFRKEIGQWAKDLWEGVKTGTDQTPGT